MLLLSPASIARPELDPTLQRIQRFASLTGGEDIVVVFLLNPPPHQSSASVPAAATPLDDTTDASGIYAYAALQTEIFNRPDIPHVPTLLLHSPHGLSQLVETYAAKVAARPQPTIQPLPTALDLLRLCTANPPMSLQTAYLLSDLFPNLRELATACFWSEVDGATGPGATTVAGVRAPLASSDDIASSDINPVKGSTGDCRIERLRHLIGDAACRDIVDFWKEEWTMG